MVRRPRPDEGALTASCFYRRRHGSVASRAANRREHGMRRDTLLAACSDTAVTPPSRSVSPGGAMLTQDPDIMNVNGRHVFRTKQWHEADNAAHGHGGGGGGGNNGIFYHGGPVLQSVTNVVAIYWAGSTIYNGGPTPGASGSNCNDGSLVGTFLSHLGPSPYFNINSTYTDGAGQHIVNAVSYAGCWANDQSAPSGSQSVSDGQMQSMILGGFRSGKIAYDPNTLYAIFTGGAVNLGGGSERSTAPITSGSPLRSTARLGRGSLSNPLGLRFRTIRGWHETKIGAVRWSPAHVEREYVKFAFRHYRQTAATPSLDREPAEYGEDNRNATPR